MNGLMMTSDSKRFGKPRTYPLRDMEIGAAVQMAAPTPADKKRIARNTSKYGLLHDRCYRCRTDKKTGMMTITRIR